MNESVRERILRTTATLFYQQGYQGTGINQIIDEAHVAKASFFNHFSSKEILLLAYARELLHQDQQLRQAVETWGNPQDRFFAAFRILNPWLKSTHFRGCPFQNLAREAPSSAIDLQTVISEHHDNLLGLFRDVARYLARNDTDYAGLDDEKTAGVYHLLFEGAISTATATRSTLPVETAVYTMKHYLRSPGN